MASGLRNLVMRSVALAALLALLPLFGRDASATPEKSSGGIRFTYHDANASSVAWAGLFNSWSGTANPMLKGTDGVWSVVIALPVGEHQYKFVVDGQWFADPENGVTAGEYGNSVVKVGPDGGLVAQAATSNTAYSAKIAIGGRVHNLMLNEYDPAFSRFQLTRPLFDIDLSFGIHISDLLQANVLANINPQDENVKDYNSRLNFKRGSLDFRQPDLRIFAFNSENIATWDDPAHLVGNVGVYGHPFGYQRNGFLVETPKLGFDTQVLYADNSSAGGTDFPGEKGKFSSFILKNGDNREFKFDGDAINSSWKLLKTRASGSGFVFVPGQRAKLTTTDIGDGGHAFGYGDGAENMFATSIYRTLPGGLRLGVLGREDRGFNLGRLVMTDVTGDSTGTVTYGETEQQWFAAGGNAQWTRDALKLHAEVLSGARRLDMMDRAWQRHFKVNALEGTGVSYPIPAMPRTYPFADSIPGLMGQHFTIDRGVRWIAGASFSFAQGDVRLTAEVEHQTHRYPAWSQPPPGASWDTVSANHWRRENVDFQRGLYDIGADDLVNHMTEWRLGWDRNWRYYLGREVKTSVTLELTHFDYDPRTAWEFQMWFPTGNFWLEQSGQQVSVDRLTLLGNASAYRLRPTLEIPVRKARNVTFRYQGDITGTKVELNPRYAESIFQFGFDVTRSLRFGHDTRWVKYDAPALKLNRGFLSQFAELRYKFSEGIQIGLGWGADPSVLDPVTNEFGPVGRETFLSDRNVNGYMAENNWPSLVSQIAAGEKALQNLRRIQFEAVVHF